MIRFAFSAAGIAALFSMSVMAAQPAAQEKKVAIDVTASQLKWEGKKVTGQHDGEVKLQSGELVFSGKDLKGGSFIIDLNTITNNDIKDAEYNTKLVSHLKSEDFFNVAKHPTAVVAIKSTKALDASKVEITADVTIRGKTNEVKFPATLETKNGKTMAKASITLDRTRWDLRYGSGKFFKNLGDKMINDEFKLDVAIASK